jgi:uncharacterized membrane protein YdjX (TVP38/TMEM64 family)
MDAPPTVAMKFPEMKSDRWVRLTLAVILAVGVTTIIFFRDRLSFELLDNAIRESGLWGPLLFIALYAVATVFFLPGSLLTLAGGALFGPLAGTFYNLTGATLGATLAFLVARYLASEWVARKAGGRMKQVMKGIEDEGWRFVAFTRLVPLFPFFLLNYALGLTRIRTTHYVLATYVSMLPAAFAFTYAGYAGRELAQGGQGLIQKGLLALGLLAAIFFLPRFVKRQRQPGVQGASPRGNKNK